MIDPLEVRTLLTVGPLNVSDMLVSQPISTTQVSPSAVQATNPGRSLAVNPNGDFVVVWTRQETVAPAVTETNIYAKYFNERGSARLAAVERASLRRVAREFLAVLRRRDSGT